MGPLLLWQAWIFHCMTWSLLRLRSKLPFCWRWRGLLYVSLKVNVERTSINIPPTQVRSVVFQKFHHHNGTSTWKTLNASKTTWLHLALWCCVCVNWLGQGQSLEENAVIQEPQALQWITHHAGLWPRVIDLPKVFSSCININPRLEFRIHNHIISPLERLL